METERVARESGGLGAKPPAESRGRAPGNTYVVFGCLAVVLQRGRYPSSAWNVFLVIHNFMYYVKSSF